MSSPPPGTGDFDPMGVARRFVKRYYQTLTTEPDRILNFYGAASFMSHGDGNMPVEPLTLKDLETKHLTERFFRFGEQVSFALENGSIDAQVSVNEAVLIVVTGHMVIEDGSRRRFCQTFFLNPQANGSKKNYYVHNDVLRFLHEDVEEKRQEEQPEVVAAPTEQSVETDGDQEEIVQETVPPEQQPLEKATTTIAVEEVVVPPPKQAEPEPEPEVVEESKSTDDDDDEAVEESKIDPDDVVEQADQKPTKNGESAGTTTASPKPSLPPGSWASLVASTASTPPPTPTRAPAPTKKKNSIQKATDKQNETATTSDKSTAPPTQPDKALESSSHRSDRKPNSSDHPHQRQNQQTRRVKRDPDCTLVIKGCPDGTKETDIRAVFERFATQTNTDILGITVSSHRGLAFVDYNSPDPVMAALKEHKANGFVLREASINVAQKTQDNKRRERDGKGGGRHSYKNRDHYEHRHHRRDGGRGGRGGGRGGRGRGGGGGGGSNAGGGDGGGGK